MDPFTRTHIIRLRTVTLALVFLVFGVIIKLFSIQVADQSTYQLIAKRQYERRVKVEAERGVIYDRHMNRIAVNLINYAFAADPSVMKNEDKDRVAKNFADVFKKPRSEYRKLLSKQTAFVWLERKVGGAVAARINDSIYGLIKLQSLRRHYPYGKAAAALLGFTDVDNQGLSGIELDQQSVLGGKDGWSILQSDALGRLRPSPDYPHEDPLNGSPVRLTIDINYQSVAYEELEKTIDKYDADDGMVIITNPRTGEILAMVTCPGFDPNKPERFETAQFRNRTITDLYEPGSTFKAFSAVAAIEENVRRPDDLIDCENGKMKVYDRVIHDSKPHAILSFMQVVQKSSNIGIIKTAQSLGKDRVYQYVRGMGFGNETGIDLEGEVKGMLKHPSEWSGLTLPMVSIGQEIGVTALQMANAYGAIANGGFLMKPFVIQSIIDPADPDRSTITEPQIIRNVASKETMNLVGHMLAEVVSGGTGQRAQIKGLQIAGKTGTAQKIDQSTHKYSPDKYTASFAGFLPVENPQLVFLVIVNNPRRSIWGETSAALTAKAIVERILSSNDDYSKSINRIIAEIQDGGIPESDLNTPDFTYMTTEAAQSILEKMDLRFQIRGQGDMITGQSWANTGKGGQLLMLETGSQIHRPDDVDSKNFKKTPDVRGLSMRMALNRMYEAGIEVSVKGHGFVIAQSPRPGTSVKSGARCVIQCRPNL